MDTTSEELVTMNATFILDCTLDKDGNVLFKGYHSGYRDEEGVVHALLQTVGTTANVQLRFSLSELEDCVINALEILDAMGFDARIDPSTAKEILSANEDALLRKQAAERLRLAKENAAAIQKRLLEKMEKKQNG